MSHADDVAESRINDHDDDDGVERAPAAASNCGGGDESGAGRRSTTRSESALLISIDASSSLKSESTSALSLSIPLIIPSLISSSFRS